jgi:hypothetical protein
MQGVAVAVLEVLVLALVAQVVAVRVVIAT